MAEIHLAAANRLFKQTEPDLLISFLSSRPVKAMLVNWEP
jgi:hypothetical protein